MEKSEPTFSTFDLISQGVASYHDLLVSTAGRLVSNPEALEAIEHVGIGLSSSFTVFGVATGYLTDGTNGAAKAAVQGYLAFEGAELGGTIGLALGGPIGGAFGVVIGGFGGFALGTLGYDHSPLNVNDAPERRQDQAVPASQSIFGQNLGPTYDPQTGLHVLNVTSRDTIDAADGNTYTLAAESNFASPTYNGLVSPSGAGVSGAGISQLAAGSSSNLGTDTLPTFAQQNLQQFGSFGSSIGTSTDPYGDLGNVANALQPPQSDTPTVGPFDFTQQAVSSPTLGAAGFDPGSYMPPVNGGVSGADVPGVNVAPATGAFDPSGSGLPTFAQSPSFVAPTVDPAPAPVDDSQPFQDDGATYDNGSDSGGGDGFGPVVLDLAGKGIDITQLNTSNTYENVTGSGYENRTAWAGAGNAVLFYDPNDTNAITQANQVVFTDWDPTATTDMQALEDVFDTNRDGSLDAGDADFSDFKLMVTNANGTTSVETLAQAGITAINLTTNAYTQTFADGSSIDGETTYTTSTGTTGTAATVTFATDPNGYAVQSTTTINADGSATIDTKALNADGSLANETIAATSADGLTRTTDEDTTGDGQIDTVQTDDVVVAFRSGGRSACGKNVLKIHPSSTMAA